MKLIGGHLNFKQPDYLLSVVKELKSINGTVAAIFVGPPQSKFRKELDSKMILEAHKFAKENNISIENFVVHAPYLVNIASSIPSSFKFSVDLMITDIKRTNQLGIKYFNLHPGSNPNTTEGIENIILAINNIIKNTKDVVLLLETTTNKGSFIGGKFEHMSQIINGIKDKSRIGVCLDTVHTWDAGYDLSNFDNIINEFDKIVGLNYLKALHISDSKNEMGSNKDRHENIGKGKIGLEVIKKIVNHPKIKNLPMILETPWDPEHKYKQEIELLIK